MVFQGRGLGDQLIRWLPILIVVTVMTAIFAQITTIGLSSIWPEILIIKAGPVVQVMFFALSFFAIASLIGTLGITTIGSFVGDREGGVALARELDAKKRLMKWSLLVGIFVFILGAILPFIPGIGGYLFSVAYPSWAQTTGMSLPMFSIVGV